jgi:L-alanine-DL-glutamate epimerase-like enolase superfamily enzyme
MKITHVRAKLYPVHNAITGWKMASGGRDSHELVFVRIDTDENFFGIGVASSSTYVSGDTAAQQLQLLDHLLGPAIIGADPFDIEAITHEMDILVKGNERTKAAIDLALYDLMGKKLGLPANRLLGGVVQPRIRVTRLMGMYEPADMAEKCLAVVRRGITALKLKVGTTFHEDVERVRRVREAVGTEVTITIDFNQACTTKEAVRRIKAMEPYDVAIVEQPVKAADLLGLAYVRQSIAPRVLADESVNSTAEALKVIECRAADVISLKIPKMGGILKVKKIAALCEAAGVEYLIGAAPGSRLFDAAGVHIATSLNHLTLPCEVGEFERMTNDPCSGLETDHGYLIPPSVPGLGVHVDLEKVGLAGESC